MLSDYIMPGNMFRQMNRFLNDWSPEYLPSWPFSSLSSSLPASNLCESKDSWYLEIAAPGIKEDQVSLSIAGNDLTVQIQRPEVDETEMSGKYWRQERFDQSSSISIALPNGINTKEISAELSNGVLVIRLPKTEVTEPKKIDVTAKKLTASK